MNEGDYIASYIIKKEIKPGMYKARRDFEESYVLLQSLPIGIEDNDLIKLSKIKHPNIQEILAAFNEDGKRYLVTPWLEERGYGVESIQLDGKGELWLQQLLSGLVYLKDKGVQLPRFERESIIHTESGTFVISIMSLLARTSDSEKTWLKNLAAACKSKIAKVEKDVYYTHLEKVLSVQYATFDGLSKELCSLNRTLNRDLEKKISTLTAEVVVLRQKVDELSAEVKRLETENANLPEGGPEEFPEDLQEELSKLRQQVHELQEKIRNLKADIARLESENERLRKAIDELRKTVAKQEIKIADLLSKCADLQRENEALKTRVMKLESANADLERDRKALMGQVEKLTTKQMSAHRMGCLWKAAITFALGGYIGWWFAFSHQDDPPLPSQEECIVKNLCDLTKKQQTELVKYVESLQQKAQRADSALIAVDKKHDELEAKLKDAEASLARERDKVEPLNGQIGELTKQKAQLQSEKAQLLSKYEEFTAEHQNCEAVAKMLADYESILAKLKEMTKAEDDKYSDLIGKVKALIKQTSEKLSPREREKLNSDLAEREETLKLYYKWRECNAAWSKSSDKNKRKKLGDQSGALLNQLKERLKYKGINFDGAAVEERLNQEIKNLNKRLGR